ncbi:MAG: ankyrin repeat domain-containing protein [Acidobacteria bacterium]|nr:ankyrin repeat domain-containing protein [Acidobacteriota bacterium]
MVDLLHRGDLGGFLKQAAADPKLLNARAPGGSTPFMYAALYAGPSTLERLLKLGADPNARNDVQATALIWAATDLGKTRVLLDHGADANARSADLRTPLMVAARRPGGSPIVKLLLDRGAQLNPNARPDAESSPLTEAATAGELETIKLLLSRGADAKSAGQNAVTLASFMCGRQCLEPIASKITDRAVLTGSLQEIAVSGDLGSALFLLDQGADPKAYDAAGRTALMYAAESESLSLGMVKLLVERGADINASSRHKGSADSGWTVLDIAKLHGNTRIVEYLTKLGAQSSPLPLTKAAQTRRENSIQKAAQDSLAPLQRADSGFTAKSGCFSCHNNSLPAMALGLARKRGLRVDEKSFGQQLKASLFQLGKNRESLYQQFAFSVFDYFGSQHWSYVLLGLAAADQPADLNTDAVAMYLKNHQRADGSWPYPMGDTRPPIGHKYIGQTALSLRALQLYPPKLDRPAYEQAVRRAASWLEQVKPITTDDQIWRVLGLGWAGDQTHVLQKARRELLDAQKPDGGWSEKLTMASTAYATGRALVALQTAGLPVSHAAYQRGVRYLLETQLEDGTWFVKSRALGFQPYFDNGSPHGFDQWISSAGTSWAAMALTLALPEGPAATRSLAQR